ncbi:MAG TPA: type IV pilus biogenesis/stability protein PilW [Caldimonas sp.]|nr:type IV pilus biogenesis/stability protein PilW [Caldimonas sp.]
MTLGRFFRLVIGAPVAAAALAAAMTGCVTTTTSSTQSAAASDNHDIATSADEANPQKRARARVDLAAAYFGRGQMTIALDQVKLALAADPNYGQAYNLRGLIFANLGDDVRAEESFKRALQIDPKDGDTLHNYGYYLCEHKRYAESTTLFRQALTVQQYRGTSRTLLALGVCQARAGDLAGADASLSRAYELDTGNPVISSNLAEVLYRRGQYERARFYIRRVNAMPNVSNAHTLWLAARIEHRLHDDRGATDFGVQLRNRFPDSREADSFARGAFDDE